MAPLLSNSSNDNYSCSAQSLPHSLTRRMAMFAALIAALLISQAASADNRHDRRGYDRYGFSGYSRQIRHVDTRRYNAYHYGNRRHSGFSVSYSNHYYPRHYQRTRYSGDAGYFVGGLVLGSLLTYPRYTPAPIERVVYRSEPVVRTREVVVVNQPTRVSAPVATGRRLLRDLDGDCFERFVDEAGDEIRVQLPAEECQF